MTAQPNPKASDAHQTAPRDVDGVVAMQVGTVLWALTLGALLISGTRLPSDNGWWLWVCLAGIGMGLVGIAFTRRRRAVYQAAAASDRQG